MIMTSIVHFFLNRALSGDMVYDSATKLYEKYKDMEENEAIEKMIFHESAKIASVGFILSVPGLPLLPVLLPANILIDSFLAVRLVLLIAMKRGKDPRSPEVSRFLRLTFLSFKGKGILKFASKSTISFIGKRIFAKAIPVVGGVAGAAIDTAFILGAAKSAQAYFKTVP